MSQFSQTKGFQKGQQKILGFREMHWESFKAQVAFSPEQVKLFMCSIQASIPANSLDIINFNLELNKEPNDSNHVQASIYCI